MMSNKALVTGGTGFLGRKVVEAFQKAGWDVIGTGFSRAKPPSIIKLDLCNVAEVEKTLDEIKPQVVVHCAANRFPDLVDKDPDGARQLNIEATRDLAKLTASRKCFLLYISTDYVFSGKPGEAPYASSDKPGPTNTYGQTKLDGELAVFDVTGDSGLAAILRVPVLYGEVDERTGNKESAVNVLVDAVHKAQSEKVVMDDWSIRYPTNTEDIGRICVDVCNTFLEHNSTDWWNKLEKRLQFSSEEKYTKYEICQILADVLGLEMEKMEANKQGNDPNASVQRPYDCHLSTQALKDMGINVQTQDFKAWWKRNSRTYRD